MEQPEVEMRSLFPKDEVGPALFAGPAGPGQLPANRPPGLSEPGDGQGGDDDPVSSADVAAYIADMLLELRTLAEKSRFTTLGRILEVAEQEAKLRIGQDR
jgi:hypothetical protein